MDYKQLPNLVTPQGGRLDTVVYSLEQFQDIHAWCVEASQAINDLSNFIIEHIPNINPEYVKALASGTSVDPFAHMKDAYKPINVGSEPKTFNINDM